MKRCCETAKPIAQERAEGLKGEKSFQIRVVTHAVFSFLAFLAFLPLYHQKRGHVSQLPSSMARREFLCGSVDYFPVLSLMRSPGVNS